METSQTTSPLNFEVHPGGLADKYMQSPTVRNREKTEMRDDPECVQLLILF